MAPKLFMAYWSPPSRAVLLLSKALNINLELIEVQLGENAELIKDELLKINPQGTVPTLQDGDKVIWDSHAINVYLLTTYSTNEELYPNDPYQRALVNQRMYFNAGVLFPPLRFTAKAIFCENEILVPAVFLRAVKEGCSQLEEFLKEGLWAVGDTITLADLALIPTVTSLKDMFQLNYDIEYPHLSRWIKRAQELPYYDANIAGLDALNVFLKEKNILRASD